MKVLAKRIITFFLAKIIIWKTDSKIMNNCSLNLNTKLEGKNVINSSSNISSSNVGYATFLGSNCYLPKCKIGRFCSIAPNVRIVVGNHPTSLFVSTHPSFFSTIKQAGFTYVRSNKFIECSYSDLDKSYYVDIGNDVWIGSNVTLLNGITIGDGAIVATGAVVTKNLEPYYIYGGVPAKKIGQRFNDSQISYLKEFKWWNKPEEWIKINSEIFIDIDVFIEKTKQKNNCLCKDLKDE